MGLDKLVEIFDALITSGDLSNEDYKFIRNYLGAASRQYQQINIDDVLEDLLLYVKTTYDINMEHKYKRGWIAKAIQGLTKYQMTKVEKVIPLSWMGPDNIENAMDDEDNGKMPYQEYDKESAAYQMMVDTIDMEYINKFLEQCLSPFEYDIYQNCIIGNVPLLEIAKKYNVSLQWVSSSCKSVKEKIKFLLYNY